MDQPKEDFHINLMKEILIWLLNNKTRRIKFLIEIRQVLAHKKYE